MLAVIETHPIQYRAPVYRRLQQQFDIPVTVIYGSDFSVAGYRDAEFGATFAWDTDLLSGYTSRFLARLAQGGAHSAAEVSAHGLRKALRETAPRAVLLVGYSPRFHQIAFYQAWRARYRILFRGETTDHARLRSPLKAWVRERALRGIYGGCDRLLYVGQYSSQHFRRIGCPDEKLIFSPYCVDTTPFQWDETARARGRPAIRGRLGISDDQTVILFSGKLYRGKGPDRLLSAVKELPASIRERIVILFMGSGELRATLEDWAQGPPPLQAHFLGFQNQTHLSPYYHAADLLVLPSLSETWGLVVNEALHHGLPCVVSDAVGCAPDLIDPGLTGEVFAHRSTQSLALALQRALAWIGPPEIRERCRQKISGYTVSKAAEGIARAYWDVTA